MSYSNGKITAPVSVKDVQQALGTSVADVGRLCESPNINVWARYKPVPCDLTGGNNTPAPLTEEQRAAEAYGVESIIDAISYNQLDTLTDYINENPTSINFIKMKAWGNNVRWHRLTDFVKTGSTTEGYNHRAKPSGVTVTSRGVAHTLSPLIPVSMRNMEIETGSTEFRFLIPRDYEWVKFYYDPDYGGTGTYEGATVELTDSESLCAFEVMGLTINDAANLTRGFFLFAVNDYDGKWYVAYSKQQEVNGTGSNATVVDKYLNLNTTGGDEDHTNIMDPADAHNTLMVKEITGRFLVVEYYYKTGSGNGTYYLIPGMSYEINISRVSTAPSSTDITGELSFVGVSSDTADTWLVMSVRVVRSLSDLRTYLRSQYDNITVAIGGSTVNVRDLPADYYRQNSVGSEWVEYAVRIYGDIAAGSTAVLTTRKTGADVSATKTFYTTR
ncbi:MAG: hypothetical protein IJ588_12590 [Prevotella sp.]|nr:hypothetical protein [Prevotella sp.]